MSQARVRLLDYRPEWMLSALPMCGYGWRHGKSKNTVDEAGQKVTNARTGGGVGSDMGLGGVTV